MNHPYLTYTLAKDRHQRLLKEASTAKLLRAVPKAQRRNTALRAVAAALVAKFPDRHQPSLSEHGSDQHVVNLGWSTFDDAA